MEFWTSELFHFFRIVFASSTEDSLLSLFVQYSFFSEVSYEENKCMKFDN